MTRSIAGLALACFLVGCGNTATDSTVLTTENAPTGTHLVQFKVPGMT